MILIIDDEVDVTEFIKDVITTSTPPISDESSIRCVTNPETVLEIVRSEDVTLIITDVLMPMMNGVELARELRLISNVPIIFISDMVDVIEADIQDIENSVATAKLTTPEELRSVIRSQLQS